VFRPLCEVHFGLYAAPAWLLQHGAPADPAALERSTRLGVFDRQTGEAQIWRLQRGSETVEIRGEPQVRFDDGEMALSACLNGAGVALAPPFAALPHVRRGDLVPLLPQWSGGTRPLQIVTPSRRHLPARVRAFIDWMLERVAADPSLTWHPSALEGEQPRS
jgi:DNA-binding transcriptional LysR family regulator